MAFCNPPIPMLAPRYPTAFVSPGWKANPIPSAPVVFGSLPRLTEPVSSKLLSRSIRSFNVKLPACSSSFSVRVTIPVSLASSYLYFADPFRLNRSKKSFAETLIVPSLRSVCCFVFVSAFADAGGLHASPPSVPNIISVAEKP
ncbi:hypothetical protein GB992_11270 [Lactobacillus rossiae]|uniref:Uncharacterized protein n=1 Tax=Furfurilactobacillus rossiae TaxID=231049 RepID=A0A7C9MUW0_9LACO|nr:hypothetical protein [Furfurilactobacillus milii]